MAGETTLAEQFESERAQLRRLAYRILGSAADADDAVQEAWLRLQRPEEAVTNLPAWLRTVVSRIALDMLRTRKARREHALDAVPTEVPARDRTPEQDAALADAVGGALMAVLDRLQPAERVAFVLHDMFTLSFDDIAGILGRSATAARQLASRARRRVRGTPARARASAAERALVAAFLAAARSGDVGALMQLLDPDVVLHADGVGSPAGTPFEIRGAATVARSASAGAATGGRAYVGLIDGTPGAVIAPAGALRLVVLFRIIEGRIRSIETIANPTHLARLRIELPR